MIACWLADELKSMSRNEKAATVALYGGVDLAIVLSRSQVNILVEAGFAPERVAAVSFGFDPGQFPLADSTARHGIVSIGSDRGRDFASLITGVSGSDLEIHLYTGEGQVRRAELPPEVVFHGRVPFAHYREIVASASIVAIPTHVMAYPSGQTVALEAAGTGACLVLTDTPAMREYFSDDTAVFVAPGDPIGWREALSALESDHRRRRQLGANAAKLVRDNFTYDKMWHQVDMLLRERGWVRGQKG